MSLPSSTRGRTALLTLLILTSPACREQPASEPSEIGARSGAVVEGSPAILQTDFAPQLNVTLEEMDRRSSGLYVHDLEVGEGAFATPGDVVSVHYTGWLPDGTQFDSSVGSEPFEFTLGEGGVIAGWDEGVAGMREGGRRQLVIPAELGYGAAGAGDVIPPGATLVFEIELLEVP